jgi:DNA-binding NtrC family response regulator
MSLVAQAKVLRVFESRPLFRLGGRVAFSPDVRFVCATNSDLATATADGRFRRDLFFRLNVTEIDIPPLRERPEDIPLLLDRYIRECAAKFKRPHEGFADEVQHALVRYSWPGNVRELRNMVEATFVNSGARQFGSSDLPEQFRRRLPTAVEPVAQNERDRLLSVLAETHWNKSEAAARLQWSRMTLYRKLAKYALFPARKVSQPTASVTGDRRG